MRLDLADDPAAFLAAADRYLAASPVLTTVIASVTERLVRHPQPDLPYCWWAVARDGAGEAVGAAMRTAPFEPHPLYVLPMPDEAAVALARLLHDRGEPVAGVNGALPASRLVAEETARLAGGEVSVHEHLRLFELGGLGELVVPPAPPGRLRAAARDDEELCLAWFHDFHRAAAEQAGRSGVHGVAETFTLEDMRARIDDRLIWLWEDEAGTPVHLTGANAPAHGVARIGPVYTPRQQRGRGYASRAVAEVSRLHLDDGVRCCLFTDQANPVSNHVYEQIGYRPVVDMANLLVTSPARA